MDHPQMLMSRFFLMKMGMEQRTEKHVYMRCLMADEGDKQMTINGSSCAWRYGITCLFSLSLFCWLLTDLLSDKCPTQKSSISSSPVRYHFDI